MIIDERSIEICVFVNAAPRVTAIPLFNYFRVQNLSEHVAIVLTVEDGMHDEL